RLLLRGLLLTGDSATGALLGARVGVSPLTPHRQSTPVANPAVTPDIHQPLDVHRDFGSEGTLHFHRTLDDLAETGDFGVREVSHPGIGADPGLREEATTRGTSDAVDVGERDFNPLLARQVHASDTRHN